MPDSKDAINALLESETFQKAPALRGLLGFLWQHRDEELNEFRIAVDAPGKREDFNPKTDSAVRVQMLRVRQRAWPCFGWILILHGAATG